MSIPLKEKQPFFASKMCKSGNTKGNFADLVERKKEHKNTYLRNSELVILTKSKVFDLKASKL